MSVRSVVGLAALAVAVAVLAVPRLTSDQRDRAGSVPPSESVSALPVEVLRLEPRPLAERLTTTGTVRANEQIDVVSEVSGVVEAIHFEEGTKVERGQILVELDDGELQARLDSVTHRLKLAESREQRQRELRAQGIASEQEYDVAANEVSVLRADARLIEEQIAKTRIRAPFDGVLGLRYISDGSFLSQQTRIATLQDLDPIKIDFAVPETYAGRIDKGSLVEFEVRGMGSMRVAEVIALEPRLDPETRSLLVRARAPNPDHSIPPGAFAYVRLTIGEIEDALVIPSLAVIPELGGKKVYVLEDGRARPRRVETGLRTEDEVQITSGLEPGESVIVSAIQRLREDLPVEIIDDAHVPEAAR